MISAPGEDVTLRCLVQNKGGQCRWQKDGKVSQRVVRIVLMTEMMMMVLVMMEMMMEMRELVFEMMMVLERMCWCSRW